MYGSVSHSSTVWNWFIWLCRWDLNLLMSSYRFHKAVALLRATLPVISVLSIAVLPTTSIPELTI